MNNEENVYYLVHIHFSDFGEKFDVRLYMDEDDLNELYDCLVNHHIQSLYIPCTARDVMHFIPDKSKILLVSSKEISEEEFKNINL